MGTCVIEVRDIAVEDATELLLVQKEQVIETLTPYASQETLTARVGAWSAEWRLEHLDT